MLHTQCVGVMVHAGGLPIKHLVPYQPDALRVEVLPWSRQCCRSIRAPLMGIGCCTNTSRFPIAFAFSR
jgi:hypothetical protein